MAAFISPALGEVRGTWLTTTGNTALTSAANVSPAVNQLADFGLNTVYVEAWKNGYTQFASPTMQALVGADRSPWLGSRDLLAETLTPARQRGLRHVAWFEYGFSAGFGNPTSPLALEMQRRGLLLTDSQGRYTNSSNGFTWMNPASPEVQRLLIDLAVEAVTTHDIDGIQFDDRLAWPVQFGYDATTRAMYLAETGRNLPSNPQDANFTAWRSGKLRTFAEDLVAAVKAARPDATVSLSPAIAGWAYDNYAVDWPAWASDGLFDEVVVQAYRSDYGQFASLWPAQVAAMGACDDRLVAGLRINGSGANTPFADLTQKVDLVRAGEAAGHSFWFSRGLLETYPTQFATFYPAVPEPAGVALSLLGGLALVRRRRA